MEHRLLAFVHDPAPQRVVFGRSTLASLPQEAGRLGLSRLLVLTTPGQADAGERVARLLGPAAAGVFSGATMHTPVEVTERACSVAARLEVDGIVAIGGGSTVGLGKAIWLRTGLPQIAIPTTYAGSEMTDLIGQTADGEKVTQRSPGLRPRTVIYDVDLTLQLPTLNSVVSGMNAIAHAAEALYAPDADPIVDLMAEEGIRALGAALPRLPDHPVDPGSRSDALYGAWLCGACLGSAPMGLHHKLCHVLGGAFDLPHAEMHSVLLPYSIAFNAEAAPRAITAMTRAFNGRDPVEALLAIRSSASAPSSLREIGMPESGVDATVRKIVASTFDNPRPVSAEPLRAMLTAALLGKVPGAGAFGEVAAAPVAPGHEPS